LPPAPCCPPPSAAASASSLPRRPGVDVTITIFYDFRLFSAKKLAFFSKNNVMIRILHYLALLWVKNANFFRCGSAVKWWKWENKWIWEDPGVLPLPRATSFKKVHT
jgi:hypothetical protein